MTIKAPIVQTVECPVCGEPMQITDPFLFTAHEPPSCKFFKRANTIDLIKLFDKDSTNA